MGWNQRTRLICKETSSADLFLRVYLFKIKSESIFCVSEILNGCVFSTILKLAKTDAHKVSEK